MDNQQRPATQIPTQPPGRPSSSEGLHCNNSFKCETNNIRNVIMLSLSAQQPYHYHHIIILNAYVLLYS